jgi:hypothetical protein
MSYKAKIRLLIITCAVIWSLSCFLAGYATNYGKLKVANARLLETRTGTLNEVIEVIELMK